MEAHIRYARTKDGVNIAYFAIGEGPPLVLHELPFSHLTAEWRCAAVRQRYEAISRTNTLVRFDHRGFGLSEASRDHTLDAFRLDLEAVAEALDLRDITILALTGYTSPIALAYAAANPDRLSHLILYLGYARTPRALSEQMETVLHLRDDWTFVAESVVRLVLGWADEEQSRELAQRLRETMSLDDLRQLVVTAAGWDVSDRLGDVRTPTLLMGWQGHWVFNEQLVRDTATRLPDARVALVQGGNSRERIQYFTQAMETFLGRRLTLDPETGVIPAVANTAIILFADIVDSTALTERLGDTTFRERARELDGSLRRIIREHAGTPIEGKLLGDGVLATFASARQAIETALACGRAGEECGLPLHLGLHAGDVIREENNVYGGAVNIAARIAGESVPGEVLVSQTVRDLARTSAGVAFEERGERELKGVGEPVTVWAVKGQDERA